MINYLDNLVIFPDSIELGRLKGKTFWEKPNAKHKLKLVPAVSNPKIVAKSFCVILIFVLASISKLIDDFASEVGELLLLDCGRVNKLRIVLLVPFTNER